MGIGYGLCMGPQCYKTLELEFIDKEIGKKYLHMAKETSTLTSLGHDVAPALHCI